MRADENSAILVLGSEGMLGLDVMDRLSMRAIGYDVDECDITDLSQIADALDELKPCSVINCAAYTAVDRAESEPERAFRLNAEAVENLGRATRERGVHLITLSTDYVFNGRGEKPFPAEAPETAYGPESVYGKSKLEGERRLREVGGDWCIARTQWLYGAGGRNFVDTIARLASEREEITVVNDNYGAVTWSVDVAEGIEQLVNHRATGCYHLVNSGYATTFEIAGHIVDHLVLPCEVKPCTSAEYPTPAKRPRNCRLLQDRYIELTGRPLRNWKEALDDYLDRKHRVPDFEDPRL